MNEQLMFFDSPVSDVTRLNLFDHQKFANSKSPQRNIKYTKGGHCIVDGRYMVRRVCCICSKQFWKSSGTMRHVVCSAECSNLKRSYGSIENKQKVTAEVIALLNSGMTNGQIAKQLGVCKTTVKTLAFEKFKGISPIHAKAVELYKGGLSEKEIADKIGKKKGTVITWLMHNIQDYVKPEKKVPVKVRREQDRDGMAKALRLYRKLKNVRMAARELEMHEEQARLLLFHTKAYHKMRAKVVTLKNTEQRKRQGVISRKYTNEKNFSDTLAAQIADYFPRVEREAPTGTTTNMDILVDYKDKRAVIECKWDVKITNIHKAIGQVIVAKNKLFAHVAVVCWPDDVYVSNEAIADCSGAGVFACPEGGLVSLLEREFRVRVAK